MERAPKTCILCGTKKRELLIQKESWKVYRCTKCRLGFLDPRPSYEEIENLYDNGYFLQRYGKGLDPDSYEFINRLRGEKHRIQFIKTIKRSGNLLDIGCGYGYFLAACKKEGYEVGGLDISERATQYAVQKLGIPVTIGKISDVSFPFHNFDVISMWHSLEHTPDPHMALQKAKSWLKSDGILVVDVPNYEGTDAQQKWQQWDDWSLPYHFWHFTFQSLAQLLNKHGFRIIKRKDYHSDVVKEKLSHIPIIRLFARLIAKMYSGTSIAVISELEV